MPKRRKRELPKVVELAEAMATIRRYEGIMRCYQQENFTMKAELSRLERINQDLQRFATNLVQRTARERERMEMINGADSA